MSLHAVAAALAYRGCPNSSAKLVLIALANFQNANGWCYPSAKRIAEETDLDLKTVRSSLAGLEVASIIIDTGKRVGRTAQVKVYSLNLESHPKADTFARRRVGDAVDPDDAQDEAGAPLSTDANHHAPAQPAAGEMHPDSDTLKTPVFSEEDTQKRVTELVTGTDTPKGAVAPSAPKGAKRDRGHRIPEDWSAPTIDELPPRAKAIAKQWPANAYATQAEAFQSYWLGEGRAGSFKKDWNRAWANEIVRLGAKPLRDAKAGVKFTAPGATIEPAALIFDKPGEHLKLCAFRRRACEVLGAYRYRWLLDDSDMRLSGERLLITVPTQLAASKIGEDGARLDRLAEQTTGARFVRVGIPGQEPR